MLSLKEIKNSGRDLVRHSQGVSMYTMESSINGPKRIEHIEIDVSKS